MTAPQSVARYTADFTRIVASRDDTPFTVDSVRLELDAAGIPPNARGPLFTQSCHAGRLTVVGFEPSTHPARRGGRCLVYKRTTAQVAA